MKILFINPPFFEVYKGFKEAAKLGAAYPPTGLLYIASTVRKAGHQVSIIDVDVEGLNMNELIEKVKLFNPDVIGITTTTPTYINAKNIIKEIKKTLSPIIVMGGIHITIMMDKILKEVPELDFGIYGEGELSFLQLIDCLKNNSNPEQVKGLIFRQNGKIKINPPREFIQDLDSLPFPAREIF